MSKHMRLKDFPSFLRTMDRDDPMEHSADATAIIYNTFDELEQPALDALPRPAYTVAPLNLLAEQLVPAGCPLDALGSNLWKEDRACLDWLDGVKEPRSVVYVNYGSITVMSNQKLVEFAWGLANSGYAFLWVVRPDLVKGDAAVLPPEFLAATRGRGLLASWCPQEEVLRDGAVGLFLTHSGGVELHAGEHLRRGAHAFVALLRRAADEFAVQVHGVGRGDGRRQRRAT
jgi:hypothetical protein